MILQGVSVDVIRKDCYDIPDKKLQGRVKFPIGGKPRKPIWQEPCEIPVATV